MYVHTTTTIATANNNNNINTSFFSYPNTHHLLNYTSWNKVGLESKGAQTNWAHDIWALKSCLIKDTWSCCHGWSYQCNKPHKSPYCQRCQVERIYTSHNKSHRPFCTSWALNANCTSKCTILHNLHS